MKKLSIFLLCIVLCNLVGILSSYFTFGAVDTWYSTLNQPAFRPPNWVFGPVWTLLYSMMGGALAVVIVNKGKASKKWAYGAFTIQLFLNFLWSIVFFGQQSLTGALVVILLLLVGIVSTMKTFAYHSKLAAYLLVPYFLWVTFATVLNLSFVLLN